MKRPALRVPVGALRGPSFANGRQVAYNGEAMGSLRVKRIRGRREGDDVLRDIDILQGTVNELRGCGLIPRGIYRFRTHEEADEWMMRQIAANHARRGSRTSSTSARL
jgi:hypothetical protein